MRPDIKPTKEAIRILRQEGIIELFKRVVVFLLKEILLIYYRFIDRFNGSLLTTPFTLSYTGKYRISTKVRNSSEFEFWYRFDSPHIRHRILGEYEIEVSEKIAEIYDEETNFWEVGVGWGYHSLSIADTVNKVVGFDPDTRRTDLLRKSRRDNNLKNISIVNDNVNSLDKYIDEFEHPDLVLVDVDGWEYEIIPNSTELLDYGCNWIVELHHNVDTPPAKENSPEDIERLFEEYGYTVDTIREHYQLKNWRGKRKDLLNTHHIIAYQNQNDT